MIILMILAAPVPPSEGIGSHVAGLARRLKERGHDVILMTRGGRGGRQGSDLEGISVVRPAFVPLYPFHVRLHGAFIRSALRKLPFSPDIVHFHSPLVPPVPVKCPVVSTFHSLSWFDFADRPPDIRYLLMKTMARTVSYRNEKKLLHLSDEVILVNGDLSEALKTRYEYKQNCHVLPNIVDPDFFRPSGHPPGRPNVLFVGRLGYGKGLGDLIHSARDVVSRYPGITYFVIGAGPLKSGLIKEVHALGLGPSFQFLGEIKDPRVILSYYRNASVVLMPSFSEGCPMVLLEALACGKPIVTTAAGFGRHLLRNGENVILVHPKSPSELARATLQLLSVPGLGRKLGEAARQTAVEAFDLKAHTDQMEEIYQRACKTREDKKRER